MKQPSDSSSPPPADSEAEAIAFEQEFSENLATVERSLQALKERYTQIQDDQHRQSELQQRFDQVQPRLRQTRSPEVRQELQAELQQIQQQLASLEVALESRLFSWDGFRDVFWQAVRFGGLGIVIGWILKSFAN